MDAKVNQLVSVEDPGAGAWLGEQNVEEDASYIECTLPADEGALGLVIDPWPVFLQVIGVEDGRISTYNASVPVRERIAPNDMIVAVNEARELESMLRQLSQRDVSVTLLVARPTKFPVKVGRGEGQSFGLKLALQKTVGTCLYVEQLEAQGAVQAHNDGAAFDNRVQVKDLIQSVNGVSGSPDQMVKELQASTVVSLEVLRVPAALTT